jgi:dihydroflavonol-4-reductase
MILVTGGAGLVGAALIAQLLQAGQPVLALYNKTPLPAYPSNLLQQMQCNILDVVGLQQAMQGVTQVYHCAAIVSFAPAQRQQMIKINVEGTANVVNAALAAGVKKMVHVSSVAALGRIRKDALINESMHWSESTSNSIYGKTKYLAEMEVYRGIGEGLDAVMVNPAIILGSGNWNEGSTKIFKTVYNEFPWYSEGVTGFVDVRDVASAMIALMNSSVSGERFILSAENTTYKAVFDLIASAFQKKKPHKKITPFTAAIAWRLAAIKSWFTHQQPLVTQETAATALSIARFDNSKLLKTLPGFTYRPLPETIAYTCQQLLQKFNNG